MRLRQEIQGLPRQAELKSAGSGAAAGRPGPQGGARQEPFGIRRPAGLYFYQWSGQTWHSSGRISTLFGA
ncbi:MAG: hypothetical protein MR428_07960 [Mesosutterella sp.]|nr:hypothetical protein [Mesosutterella sp.]